MRYYIHIGWFENKRRLELVLRLRSLLELYYANSTVHYAGDPRVENDKAVEARRDINRILDASYEALHYAHVNPNVTYTPAPITGGYQQNINVLLNLFNLSRYQIPPETVFDYIDRAIGVYERNKRPALLRTLNPIYWLGLFLDWLVSLPFLALGRVGFSREKIEDSLLGRLVKFALYLVGALASLLTVLQLTGRLDDFNSWLKGLV